MSRIRGSWMLRAGGVLLALLVPVSGAQAANNEQILHAFVGGSEGQYPTGRLVLDKTGNVYGTTYINVFKLTAGGTLEVLHTFPQGIGSPNGLMMDDHGPLFGTTSSGAYHRGTGDLYGTTSAGGAYHHGTVFRLAPDGSYTILHSFADGNDGARPRSALIMDAAGNLYGTTNRGGAYDAGTVFEVAPNGVETVLYTFTGGDDGGNPVAGLIMDDKGNLYGTTQGGAYSMGNVFKLTPQGQETVLHDFDGADGCLPWGTLIMDEHGNLYGTTLGGGASNKGVVFMLTAKGQAEVLHSFAGGSDGSGLQDGLVRDVAGNLYGVTYLGGTFDKGTVFKIAPNGTETVLYDFRGGEDGWNPSSPLLLDAHGNLYGTTDWGGFCHDSTNGCGIVFKFGE